MGNQAAAPVWGEWVFDTDDAVNWGWDLKQSKDPDGFVTGTFDAVLDAVCDHGTVDLPLAHRAVAAAFWVGFHMLDGPSPSVLRRLWVPDFFVTSRLVDLTIQAVGTVLGPHSSWRADRLRSDEQTPVADVEQLLMFLYPRRAR